MSNIKAIKLDQLQAKLIRTTKDTNKPKVLTVHIMHDGHIITVIVNAMVYQNYVIVGLKSSAKIYYNRIKSVAYNESENSVNLLFGYDDNDLYFFKVVYPSYQIYQIVGSK